MTAPDWAELKARELAQFWDLGLGPRLMIAKSLREARRDALIEAANICEQRAIQLAEAAARAEKAGRTKVADFRYSESETLDGVMIAIQALGGEGLK